MRQCWAQAHCPCQAASMRSSLPRVALQLLQALPAAAHVALATARTLLHWQHILGTQCAGGSTEHMHSALLAAGYIRCGHMQAAVRTGFSFRQARAAASRAACRGVRKQRFCAQRHAAPASCAVARLGAVGAAARAARDARCAGGVVEIELADPLTSDHRQRPGYQAPTTAQPWRPGVCSPGGAAAAAAHALRAHHHARVRSARARPHAAAPWRHRALAAFAPHLQRATKASLVSKCWGLEILTDGPAPAVPGGDATGSGGGARGPPFKEA